MNDQKIKLEHDFSKLVADAEALVVRAKEAGMDLSGVGFYDRALELSKVGVESGEVVVGLHTLSIEVGKSVVVNVQSEVIFRPEVLFISPDSAHGLVVTDVRIGNISQLVAPAVLPASLFTSRLFGPRLRMDVLRDRTNFTVELMNLGDETVRFEGAIIGRAMERLR